MCMGGYLPTFISVYLVVHAWCPQRSEEAVGSPRTRGTDSGKMPCGAGKSSQCSEP